MTIDTAMTLVCCLLGLIFAVLLAGVPWAYSIGTRMAWIEVKLENLIHHEKRIASLEFWRARAENHENREG